jgi:hypothetical protein
MTPAASREAVGPPQILTGIVVPRTTSNLITMAMSHVLVVTFLFGLLGHVASGSKLSQVVRIAATHT